MKQNRNHFKRALSLSLQEAETTRLEAFIEKICDDFHIYDAYFGNILAANTLVYELCLNKKGNGEGKVGFAFESKPSGLYFTIQLQACFLDVARLFELAEGVELDDPQAYDPDFQEIMMVKLLTDNVTLDGDNGSVELVFYITGINDALTNQRIELLERYFAELVKVKKV